MKKKSAKMLHAGSRTASHPHKIRSPLMRKSSYGEKRDELNPMGQDFRKGPEPIPPKKKRKSKYG